MRGPAVWFLRVYVFVAAVTAEADIHPTDCGCAHQRLATLLYFRQGRIVAGSYSLVAGRGLMALVIVPFAGQQAQKANSPEVEGHNHEPH
jgi:hypothetical protein